MVHELHSSLLKAQERELALRDELSQAFQGLRGDMLDLLSKRVTKEGLRPPIRKLDGFVEDRPSRHGTTTEKKDRHGRVSPCVRLE